jgi:hypothetical protein
MGLCLIRRATTTAALIVAFSAGAGISTSASDSGGISGHLFDARGSPLRDATITYWRPADSFWVDTKTDKRGFFSDVDLEAGRYYVALFVHGATTARMEACAVTDVFGGEQRRVSLRAGECLTNADLPVRSLVDPDETADVYRI